MWLQAPNISCIHGFSTRNGGISPVPFNSLNLGGSDDEATNIQENRHIALNALSLNQPRLFTLRQVHGDRVCQTLGSIQEGDALVSDERDAVIAVLVADCYPVLFYDEKNAVIGAAHCGWRGTLAGIAGKTVEKMRSLGADPVHIRVAVGQGISQKNFEVGDEVLSQFRKNGYPESAWEKNHLDLIQCILFNLKSAGITEKNTWVMNRCTFEPDFFSYRRDKGKTGRMMGLISQQQK